MSAPRLHVSRRLRSRRPLRLRHRTHHRPDIEADRQLEVYPRAASAWSSPPVTPSTRARGPELHTCLDFPAVCGSPPLRGGAGRDSADVQMKVQDVEFMNARPAINPLTGQGLPKRAGDRGRTGDVQLGKRKRPRRRGRAHRSSAAADAPCAGDKNADLPVSSAPAGHCREDNRQVVRRGRRRSSTRRTSGRTPCRWPRRGLRTCYA